MYIYIYKYFLFIWKKLHEFIWYETYFLKNESLIRRDKIPKLPRKTR